MAETRTGSLRWIALVVGVLGVLCLIGGTIAGVTGVEIDIPGERTYDCGSLFGRLGGDDAETKWATDTFLFRAGNEGLAEEDLPRIACKDATDDRYTIVKILYPVGAVLLVAAVVLFFVGSRRGREPAPADEPFPERGPAEPEPT
jgi:hypothetical protein